MFELTCPHCAVRIPVEQLHRRRPAGARWYHLIPTYHLSCPRCEGAVRMDTERSLPYMLGAYIAVPLMLRWRTRLPIWALPILVLVPAALIVTALRRRRLVKAETEG